MSSVATRLGPPFTVSGTALWLVRNFVEALIWASAGAVVLVLLLAVHRYPWMATGLVVSVLIAGVIVFALFTARRSKEAMSPASVLRFEFFSLKIKIIVGSQSDPQSDRL